MKDINIQGIPIVVSKGNPYELGWQHGCAVPDKIKEEVELMLTLCEKNAGLDRNECLSIAGRFVPAIEKYNPDYLTEIQGIAEGAGLSFEEIIFLNARTEMLKLGNGTDRKDSISLKESGCTSIAVTGEVTKDGHTYVGQTWDNLHACLNTMIAHLVIPDSGTPSFFYVGEAGIISRMGMNSAGIGIGVNSLSTNGPFFRSVPEEWT